MSERASPRFRFALRGWVAEPLWRVDDRSLAALRVALGAIQIGLLTWRLPDLFGLLTDQGVLPSSWLRQHWDPTYWSLYHFHTDSYLWQFGLWATHLTAAVAMCLGWRTKVAIAVCLVLTWSLQTRNPFILTAGDVWLRLQLAWLLWLPCGRRWSLDSRRRGENASNPGVLSWASRGLILQLACVYWFAGWAKWNEYWWSGRAVEMALQLELHVRPVGARLLQWPMGLSFVTWGTLLAELILPVLILTPWRTGFWRSVAAAVFCALHLGVWLTLSVGWFSLIGIVSWVILVPAQWWNRWRPAQPQGLPIATADAAVRHPHRTSEWIAAGLVVYTLMINAMGTLPMAWRQPAEMWLRRVGNVLMVNQEFTMFGTPPLVSPRFEIPAVTADGREIDLLAWLLGLPGGQRPERAYDHVPSHAWRRYLWHLVEQPGMVLDASQQEARETLRGRLLAYLVARYDGAQPAGSRLKQAALICEIHSIAAPRDPSAPPVRELWATYKP